MKNCYLKKITKPEFTDGVRMRLTFLFIFWQRHADIIGFLKDI